MALRSVMHSHRCRNFPPVTALDSLPILPDLAKDLNFRRDSTLAIPRLPVDHQAVSVRGRDLVMGRAVPAVYRAYPSSAGPADPSDSRDSVPGFADSVAADYSWPAVGLAFVGPGFVAVRLVTVAVVVVVAAARLSFDPSCSADFSGAVAAVASDVASVSQSSS